MKKHLRLTAALLALLLCLTGCFGRFGLAGCLSRLGFLGALGFGAFALGRGRAG